MREKHEYKTIVHPLRPLFDRQSRILILGSFPSIKTREMNFFYGHPRNRFWKIMEKILSREEPFVDPDEKRRVLLEHKIALWDSIYQCDIIGSGDASIKNAVPTDLSMIFQTANIVQVFCNGATSFKYYRCFHEKTYHKEAILLPSTSPANAAYSLEKLIEEWAVIQTFLQS